MEPEAEPAAAPDILDDLPTFDPTRVVLSNGIVLGTKPVPFGLQRRIVQRIPLPPVPIVEGPGGIDEENPDDPDYIVALDLAQQERLNKVNEALITLGTDIESVPEGMFRPDEDGWIEQLREFGAEPEFTSGLSRYRAWLDSYALASPDDAGRTWAAVVARSGVLESEVLRAMDHFRNRAQRATDNGLSAAQGDTVGDQLRADTPGDSPANGGTGRSDGPGDPVGSLGNPSP